MCPAVFVPINKSSPVIVKSPPTTTSPLNVAGAGTLVGQKPVESIKVINRTSTTNDARILRYFSNVERAFVLKAGQVMVSA